jgi:hypothetical protein
MLILARIKLTKAWLGDQQPGNDGVRRFQKAGHLMKVNDAMWRAQFKEAVSNLHLRINDNAIQPPRELLPASIHLYTRHYSQVKVDYFESFRKGTVLNIQFLVKESGLPAPSLEQFTQILKFVGQWLGLSPWGNKFGYGTFDVLETSIIV